MDAELKEERRQRASDKGHGLPSATTTEEALDVFKSMQAAGVEEDVIFYGSLINACAKKTEQALDVFRSMQAAGVEP